MIGNWIWCFVKLEEFFWVNIIKYLVVEKCRKIGGFDYGVDFVGFVEVLWC